MPLAAVESPRLYRQIADQLRHLIERREFPVGGRLPPERELAEKLGVSRPSVREALIALEVEGRVRIRMGSGVYVTEPSRATLTAAAGSEEALDGPYDVLGARALVESGICAEAAGLAAGDDIAGLDDILTRMDRPDLPTDELIALDRAFHVAIATILRNSVLTRIVGSLFDQRINPYFRQLASHFENETSWRAALDEHRAIRNALAAASGADAREAMRIHLDRSRERFFVSFGEGFPTGQESVSACPAGKN